MFNWNRYSRKSLKSRITKYIVPVSIFIMFLFSTMAFAAINTELSITGEANFRREADIRITDYKLISMNGAIEDYKSNFGMNSIINGITLSNNTSTITYEVTVQNLGNIEVQLAQYYNQIYSNNNIKYRIEGIAIGDSISAQSEKKFTIVFYNNTSSAQSLESTIHFEFSSKKSSLMVASTSSNYFYRSTLLKTQIESVNFSNSLNIPTDSLGSFDVSEDEDGSVMMWYKDSNSNGLYEVTIGSVGGVKANVDSSYMFSQCRSIKSINLTNLDTSDATTMEGMFEDLENMTVLNLDGINTSNVENMTYMFFNCSSLTSLDLSGFNTNSVTKMPYMFFSCSSLTSLDLSSLNTSSVTEMIYMFYDCSNLVSLNLSSFDTSNVKNFSYMFYGNNNLINLDLSSFNTSNVTSMQTMFYGCTSLTSLNISSFNTSKVTTMSSMFRECSSLTSLNVTNFNTSSVTTMSYMFYGCSGLTNLDLTSFNTSKVTTMSNMFASTTKMSQIKVSTATWVMASNITSMFNGSGVSAVTYY